MRASSFSYIGLTFLTTLFTPSYQTPIAPSVDKVFQFPLGTWIENIAVRSNGQLLVTLLTAPELHLIDPSANPPTSKLIHSFKEANVTGLLGITELEHDVFAIVADALPLAATPGDFAIWKADFRRQPASINKIADVPSGQLLNGIAKLDSHTLLITDSMAGNIVKLDVKTGKSKPILEDASMKPGTINGSFVKAGVNGLKIQDSYVYYTNAALASLYRVRIDCSSGKATGPFEVIASGMPDADDFALQRDGTAFVAVGSSNVVEKVVPSGGQSIYAGNLDSGKILGPTAAAIGRGKDRDVLYVVTNGRKEGGSVIAVGLR
jgi:hypothetical protein